MSLKKFWFKRNGTFLVSIVVLLLAILVTLSSTGIVNFGFAGVAPTGLNNIQKQEMLNVLNSAKILWAHDGKNCNQECGSQLGATCISSVISFWDRVNRTSLFLSNDLKEGDVVWAEVPQTCNTIYKMGRLGNVADIRGQRLNVCLCAKP